MNKNLLDITIPTYERKDELINCLISLKQEISILSDIEKKIIRVVICDNHSNYDVKLLADELMMDISILCIKNHSNIGMYKNFMKCYSLAEAEYTWLLSDDDMIVEGCLKLLILDLLKYSPDCAFLEFTSKNSELESKEVLKDGQEFLKKVNIKPTLISAIIIKTIYIKQYNKFSENYFCHFYYTLNALSIGKSFLLYNKQIIKSPYKNNSGGYAWFDVFVNELDEVITSYNNNFNKSTIRNLKKTILNRLIIPQFYALRMDKKSLNSFTKKKSKWYILKMIFLRYNSYPDFYIKLPLLTILPKNLIRILKQLIK